MLYNFLLYRKIVCTSWTGWFFIFSVMIWIYLIQEIFIILMSLILLFDYFYTVCCILCNPYILLKCIDMKKQRTAMGIVFQALLSCDSIKSMYHLKLPLNIDMKSIGTSRGADYGYLRSNLNFCWHFWLASVWKKIVYALLSLFNNFVHSILACSICERMYGLTRCLIICVQLSYEDMISLLWIHGYWPILLLMN